MPPKRKNTAVSSPPVKRARKQVVKDDVESDDENEAVDDVGASSDEDYDDDANVKAKVNAKTHPMDSKEADEPPRVLDIATKPQPASGSVFRLAKVFKKTGYTDSTHHMLQPTKDALTTAFADNTLWRDMDIAKFLRFLVSNKALYGLIKADFADDPNTRQLQSTIEQIYPDELVSDCRSGRICLRNLVVTIAADTRVGQPEMLSFLADLQKLVILIPKPNTEKTFRDDVRKAIVPYDRFGASWWSSEVIGKNGVFSIGVVKHSAIAEKSINRVIMQNLHRYNVPLILLTNFVFTVLQAFRSKTATLWPVYILCLMLTGSREVELTRMSRYLLLSEVDDVQRKKFLIENGFIPNRSLVVSGTVKERETKKLNDGKQKNVEDEEADEFKVHEELFYQETLLRPIPFGVLAPELLEMISFVRKELALLEPKIYTIVPWRTNGLKDLEQPVVAPSNKAFHQSFPTLTNNRYHTITLRYTRKIYAAMVQREFSPDADLPTLVQQLFGHQSITASQHYSVVKISTTSDQYREQPKGWEDAVNDMAATAQRQQEEATAAKKEFASQLLALQLQIQSLQSLREVPPLAVVAPRFPSLFASVQPPPLFPLPTRADKLVVVDRERQLRREGLLRQTIARILASDQLDFKTLHILEVSRLVVTDEPDEKKYHMAKLSAEYLTQYRGSHDDDLLTKEEQAQEVVAMKRIRLAAQVHNAQ